MEKHIHDQTTGREIIYVPMPFTEDGLKYIVAHMNGWEDDPDLVQDYVDAIMSAETVHLNPSSSLGEGANIVDIFSFGLMAIAKHWNLPDPDIDQLWHHPMRNKIVTRIKSIEVEEKDCEIISNEHVMTEAIDRVTGQLVTADQAACPGNSDNLEAYGRDPECGLPF